MIDNSVRHCGLDPQSPIINEIAGHVCCAMCKQARNDVRSKILKGIQISFDKLVIEKAKNDDYLIFEKDGYIIKIKAKDILKEKTK